MDADFAIIGNFYRHRATVLLSEIFLFLALRRTAIKGLHRPIALHAVL
jgi:hypothetical protein